MGPQTSIQPADMEALARRNLYTGLMSGNAQAVEKAHNPALAQAFAAFRGSLDSLIGAADRLPVILGRPTFTVTTEQQMSHAPNGGYGADNYPGGRINGKQTVTRQPVKATPFMLQALAQADARRAEVVPQAQQQAVDLLDAALATVAPSLPNFADRESVGYIRADVVALLEASSTGERQGVAAGLLSDAVADHDAVTLAVLLGDGPESIELVARRLPGLDIRALRGAYITQTVAAAPSGVNGGTGMFSAGVPAVAAFVQLQATDRGLAAAGMAAEAYFDYQRANVATLITR